MGKIIPCTEFARAGRARLRDRIQDALNAGPAGDPGPMIDVGRLIVDESNRLYSRAVTPRELDPAPHLFVIASLIRDGHWKNVPTAEKTLLDAAEAYFEAVAAGTIGA